MLHHCWSRHLSVLAEVITVCTLPTPSPAVECLLCGIWLLHKTMTQKWRSCGDDYLICKSCPSLLQKHALLISVRALISINPLHILIALGLKKPRLTVPKNMTKQTVRLPRSEQPIPSQLLRRVVIRPYESIQRRGSVTPVSQIDSPDRCLGSFNTYWLIANVLRRAVDHCRPCRPCRPCRLLLIPLWMAWQTENDVAQVIESARQSGPRHYITWFQHTSVKKPGEVNARSFPYEIHHWSPVLVLITHWHASLRSAARFTPNVYKVPLLFYTTSQMLFLTCVLGSQGVCLLNNWLVIIK